MAKPRQSVGEKHLKIDENSKPMDYVEVPGIGLIRACCHQTARLAENYCTCGRHVSPNLIAHFKN